jgi:DNA repair protein RadA/Sms
VTKWVGQGPQCQSFGTSPDTPVAASRTAPRRVAAGAPAAPARPIGTVELDAARARPTGVTELDRVLGGGLVPGVVVLLAGEPGAGKSTLLLDVAARAAAGDGPVLYATGEESVGQVRLRAERTGAVSDGLYLAAESDLGAIVGHLDALRPTLLVVDSVQTVSTGDADGAPGGVTQVRAVTVALTALAKERGLPVILVGHVTKDGSVAGPRVLEHLVDVVLHFEGDRHSTLRLVRGIKNRYGPADEVGCFELRDDGIHGVSDPSGLFLADASARRSRPTPGTAITVAVEGKRPLLAEVQALVAGKDIATPRRAVSGLDYSRVAMVLAVLERRSGIHLADADVFTATVGGMRLTEPAADLAVALAVASAKLDLPVPPGLVVLGELGLTGEIRRIAGLERRLAEATRLGFTTAVVPANSGLAHSGLGHGNSSDGNGADPGSGDPGLGSRDGAGQLGALRVVGADHLDTALALLRRRLR